MNAPEPINGLAAELINAEFAALPVVTPAAEAVPPTAEELLAHKLTIARKMIEAASELFPDYAIPEDLAPEQFIALVENTLPAVAMQVMLLAEDEETAVCFLRNELGQPSALKVSAEALRSALSLLDDAIEEAAEASVLVKFHLDIPEQGFIAGLFVTSASNFAWLLQQTITAGDQRIMLSDENLSILSTDDDLIDALLEESGYDMEEEEAIQPYYLISGSYPCDFMPEAEDDIAEADGGNAEAVAEAATTEPAL